MGIPSLYSVLLQREDSCSLQASFILCKQRAFWGFSLAFLGYCVRPVMQIAQGDPWRGQPSLRSSAMCRKRGEANESLCIQAPCGGHSSAFPEKTAGTWGVGRTRGSAEESLVPDQAYLWWLRLQHRLVGRGDSSGSSRSPVPHR